MSRPAICHGTMTATHRFLDGRVVVETMAYQKRVRGQHSDRSAKRRTLQDVDVVKLQALQALLDRVKNMLPIQTTLVDIAEFIGIYERNSFPSLYTGNRIVDL
jgi:hypothetical protein